MRTGSAVTRPKKPAPSSTVETAPLTGWYLSDGTELWWVVNHTAEGIRLENCYTNMQTYFTYPEFVKMGLKKVAKRGPEVKDAA